MKIILVILLLAPLVGCAGTMTGKYVKNPIDNTESITAESTMNIDTKQLEKYIYGK